jgi:dihydroxyacetone kinase-like predicted kinase
VDAAGVLDAGTIRRFSTAALAALRRHRWEIDGLNVYPVRDHDTGTNLVLTFEAADRALRLDDGTGAPGAALRRMARGALLGAHGNSGVILAQLLGGLADHFEEHPARDGRTLADALDRGVRAAYRAVGEPAEGTVLTVARAAAAAALTTSGPGTPAPAHRARVTLAGAVAGGPGVDGAAGRPAVGEVAEAAYRAATAALEATRGQLPALAKAGVVDAGGRGLVLLLGALCESVGIPVEEPAADLPPAGQAAAGDQEPVGDGSPEYEIQYVLEAGELAVARLRGELSALGDSLVVTGDGAGLWQVHVHTDDAGAAVEAGIRAGRPSRICITRLTDTTHQPADPHQTDDLHQAGEDSSKEDRDRAGDASLGGGCVPAGESRAAGVVVMVEGDGLVGLCGAAGAGVVDVAGLEGAPTVAGVVAAVRERGALHTVLVPAAVAWHPVAVRAAEEVRAAGLAVSVVPARSPVQVLAALAVHDPARGRNEDVIAMAEAAAGCRHGRVEVASEEALTMVGRCRPGDVLGLVDDDVVLIAGDPAAVGVEVLDRLLSGGGELVTLVSGAAVPDGLVAALTGHLARRWPLVEVAAHHGGQRGGYLLVGVE